MVERDVMEAPTGRGATAWMYLIRHGATDNNLATPPRLQGRGANRGLSAAGRRQAASVAGLLADVRLDAIYSSPLLRAHETAVAIAARQTPPIAVTTADVLTEADVGAWEEKSWEQIQREEPEYYHRFMTDPEEVGYRGGESLSDVHARVVPALRSLLQRHAGGRIAVVAHNVVNRCFVAHLLGVPLRLARDIVQDNGGVNVIRHKGGKCQLMTMNATFHL